MPEINEQALQEASSSPSPTEPTALTTTEFSAGPEVADLAPQGRFNRSHHQARPQKVDAQVGAVHHPRRNHFARFSLTSFALARIVYAQIMHAAANGYDGADDLGHPPRVPHPGMTAIHHAMAHVIDNRRGHLNREIHRSVPGKRP